MSFSSSKPMTALDTTLDPAPEASSQSSPQSYCSGGDTIIPIPDDYPSEKIENPQENDNCTQSSASAPAKGLPAQIWVFLIKLWPKKKPSNYDRKVTETRTRSLEECPEGYPQLAAFLSSEPNFSQYRGFSYLHSRCLLDLQHDLSTLEKELDDLDEEDNNTEKGQNKLQCRERDERAAKKANHNERTRRKILDDVREKLINYDEILIRARDMLSFQRPSLRDYHSVRAYFVNESPLRGDEDEWILKKEDILTLRHGRESAHFDGWVETQLNRFRHCKFVRKMFTTPEFREKTKKTHIYYFSEVRVQKLTSLLITIVVFVLLVLPVVAMYRLTSFGSKSTPFDAVGVLIVFTLLFSASMSLLTKAARHELFAASAAYCAVLVVFISNFGGNDK